MEVFSAGKTDLDQLVMFVVDAAKRFSSLAKFEGDRDGSKAHANDPP
jgi:hypothetical protein